MPPSAASSPTVLLALIERVPEATGRIDLDASADYARWNSRVTDRRQP